MSFRIDTNWKLGFIGRNGRGKTTFLQLLLGKYPYSGVITSDMEFEYFPYEVNNPADYTIDIIQNICPIAEDWQIYRELSLLKVSDDVLYRPFSTLSNGEQGIDESLMKAILRKLDFSRVQFEKNMEHFSDGQKKKVLIAGSLCKKAHLYIWDDPLNYIDVWSRIQLEELLNTYRPTLLLVEHDRTFCEQIGAKIISLNH